MDGAPDREEKDQYKLTIIASDFGSPPLRHLFYEFPMGKIMQHLYQDNFSEDAPEGSSVVQVKAHDDDEDSGILYSILQSEQGLLVNIDPLTGIISTAAGLGRETRIRSGVFGGGSGLWFLPLTSTTTASLSTEDVNDNGPVFQQQIYNITI